MGEVEALHMACRAGNAAEIEAILLKKPHLVNVLDAELGWSPLYRAIMCGHYEAAKVLLIHGANPNMCNRQGETPLHQAVCNSVTLTELLLENDADPNVQQQEGDTPLHQAAFRGDTEMTKLLISHGAQANVKNYLFGKTALHYASEGGFVPVVQLLLEAGASVGIRDKKGKKPTDVAISSELMRLLSLSPDVEVKKPKITPYTSRISELETTARVNMSNFEETDTQLHQHLRYDRDLEEWLDRNRLGFLLEPLTQNGFDDFSLLIDTMRSEVPLTKDMIAPICMKVGHAARLLGLLELEARGDRETYLPDASLWCTNTTLIETDAASLEDWLYHLNVASLIVNFKESGYEDLEHLRLLQKTKMKITDEVLEQEIGIKMMGWRHRILMRLWQDTEAPVIVRKHSSRMEDSKKQTSCKDCKLM
mmetsp:Transcript_8370/g.16608  ORF Transcript_8370/g.16608 Transcript_8370/m.16608 type:complete len:422 (-) Transcript_8370:1402-2667(-)